MARKYGSTIEECRKLKNEIHETADGWKVIKFDSWGEMVERAANRPQSSFATQLSSRKNESGGWYGKASWEDALRMAREGWPEGSSAAAKLSAVVREKIGSIMAKAEIQFDVTGQDYDIGLVNQGVPECWYYSEEKLEDGPGKFIRLVFNNCTSGGVSANVMARKGAAVGAVVELLELAGHHVEVILACANAHWLWQTTIKTADQPLDIDRLMFALAHPASFRRLHFSLFEEYDAFMKQHSSSYGRVMEVPKSMQGDIYIAGSLYSEPQWASEEAAQRWVIDQLKAQGVKISE